MAEFTSDKPLLKKPWMDFFNILSDTINLSGITVDMPPLMHILK